MAAPRGRAQSGRTGSDPTKPVRPQVTLTPGDPVRVAYDELVGELNISGAEVVRRGILALRQAVPQPGAGAALQEAG
ncbi:hypothetical protein [Streptomyces sp. NRRL F-5630]|uniref:hypothetical protein n=1 Tax=Streptomyces sp. NRRL F-5630 TaxID=1463864 RepID=UPI003EBDED30